MKLDAAIKEPPPELANRRGVEFHHDNMKSYTSLLSRKICWKLGWMWWLLTYIPCYGTIGIPFIFGHTKFFKWDRLRRWKSSKISCHPAFTKEPEVLQGRDHDVTTKMATYNPCKWHIHSRLMFFSCKNK